MSSNSTAIDVNISSSNPDTVSNSETEITVMTGSTTTMLMHWKMPTLPTVPLSAKIVDARITLVEKTIYGVYVGAYEVLNDWDETLTWTKYINTSTPQGALGNMVDYVYIEWPGAYEWNITKLAEKWYKGNNFGVAFQCIPMRNTIAYFYSANATSNRPSLTVTYKDMKGIESYWSYSSHSAGTAGNGNVNLAVGNLIFTIPTLTTTDRVFAYTPTLIYDSSMANKVYNNQNSKAAYTSSYLGFGFKLNMCETVISEILPNTTTTCYVYSDADGTEHYFFEESTGKYRDEDGLGLTLTLDSAGNISITNEAKTVRYFEKITDAAVGIGWRLTTITDLNGNKLVFTFSEPYKPFKISLLPKNSTSYIDLLEFYYYSNGNLKMIYNPYSKMAVVIRYSNSAGSVDIINTANKYLKQINYAYGNSSVTMENWESFASSSNNKTNITVYSTVNYTYDSSGNLIEAINNTSNTSLKYSYNANKVLTVTEYAGSTKGRSLGINIRQERTVVNSSGNDGRLHSSDDINVSYVLDRYGRCVSVYTTNMLGDALYGASAYTYDMQSNSINSISQSATFDDNVPNYLLNGSFEKLSGSMPEHWIASANVYHTTLNTVDGSFDKSITFMPPSGYSSYIYQALTLTTSDEFTFAMPISCSNANSVTGTVSIIDQNTSEVIYTEEILPLPTDGRTFFTMTFEVPYTVTDGKILLKIAFTSASSVSSVPVIEIDSLMLSKTLVGEKYNLLENGSFDSTYETTNNGQTYNIANYWTDQDNNALSVSYLDSSKGMVATVNNTYGSEKYIKQVIYTASQERLTGYDQSGGAVADHSPHTFAVSGFARSESSVSSKPFRLKAEIVYYRGASLSDITTVYYFNFVPIDLTTWQYTAGTFTLGYDQSGEHIGDYLCVKSISVYADVTGNYGINAYFNDLSVTYEGVNGIEKYTYTDDGKIESYVCGEYGEYYTYDLNGNIATVTDSIGNIVTYSCNANGRINSITYNSPGTDTMSKTVAYVYNTYGMLTKETTYICDSSGAIDTSARRIESTYTYITTTTSKIFGAMSSEKHLVNSEIKYFYDSNTGNLLASVHTQENIGTAYSYDGAGRIIGVHPATYVPDTESFSITSGEENVSYTYNSKNYLSTISTGSTTYTLLYTSYGKQSAIKIGDTSLATYEYKSRNGNLSKVTYANGQIVKYVYNDLELLTEIWYNSDTEPAYEYKYTTAGKLYMIVDNVLGIATQYEYDADERVVAINEYSTVNGDTNYSQSVAYNDRSYVDNILHVTPYRVGTSSKTITSSYGYGYDSYGRVTSENISIGTLTGDVSYAFDSYDRLSSSSYSFDDNGTEFNYSVDYSYLNPTSTTTTPLVWDCTVNIQSGDNSENILYGFVYNLDGSIDRIVRYCNDNIDATADYWYDDLSQLVREDNSKKRQTYVYEYDDAGNIVSKITYSISYNETITSALENTDTYVYGDSTWGDLLTSYNGTAITYDAIGNPLSYYNGSSYTFTWNGRKLATATKGTDTMSFAYDDGGIRVSKTVNGVTTHYVYSGSLLISEYTDTETIVYIYDSKGLPIGFRYRASTYADGVWDTYWYGRNPIGDIVSVYSSSAVKLVSYYYDAWGNTTVFYSNNGSSTTAVKNNLTYRGYYYDSDLGMYYLQSRYYDPVICRFINADSYVSTGQGILGYNMFAYCNNNPVMYVDPNGNASLLFWIVVCIIGLNFGAILESELATATDDVAPMDDDTFEKINEPIDEYGGDSSGLTKDEQLAYVRKVREVWMTDDDPYNDYMLDEWSEADMVREIAYHDSMYQIFSEMGLDQITLAKQARFVHFESQQNYKTYARRNIGNLVYAIYDTISRNR